jgi:hypothetical protein
MAKRKQAAAAAAEDFTPPTPPQSPEVTPPPSPESPTSADASPKADAPQPRQLTPDPFTFKTVNLDGYKMHFQHSRQSGEFQMKFGDGSIDDMPPDAIRDAIKAKKIQVETKTGEKKEVQLFHWNDPDRAWGMRIDRKDVDGSRETAKAVFDEVVKLVAEDRKARAAERAASGSLPPR